MKFGDRMNNKFLNNKNNDKMMIYKFLINLLKYMLIWLMLSFLNNEHWIHIGITDQKNIIQNIVLIIVILLWCTTIGVLFSGAYMNRFVGIPTRELATYNLAMWKTWILKIYAANI